MSYQSSGKSPGIPRTNVTRLKEQFNAETSGNENSYQTTDVRDHHILDYAQKTIWIWGKFLRLGQPGEDYR